MSPLLLLTIYYSRLQNSAYTNKLPNYQEQMKKDLYKDIRLFLLAIIAVSLFFSCSSVPSGIAEEITYHGEQLHRYLTIIKDVTTKAEKSKDTITYYCNQKGQLIIERAGTDSLDDYTYSYVGDTIFIHKKHNQNPIERLFKSYYIVKNGLIVEANDIPQFYTYTYDNKRRLVCRDTPNTLCGRQTNILQWKGEKILPDKSLNITYRDTGEKTNYHNLYYFWMFGSGIRIPIPFITLGYMGVIPKGDISSYSFSSKDKDFNFKSQLTTEYDKEGRPTRIEEVVTTLNKNNKEENSKYVTEYIW